jgi:hypothetical protein
LSNIINPIHTCCKRCVFAQYEEKTQTGCLLNYIDKYKNIGSEILEAYDEDLEFYIINNKKCLGYREDTYFKKIGMENNSIDQKISHIKETSKLNYLCLVNLREFDNMQFNNLLEEFQNVSILPQKIIFIRYMDQSPLFEYHMIQDFLDKTSINGQWRLQTMLSTEMSNEQILHSTINLNKKYRFILSIEEADGCVSSIIEKANKIVYEDLGQFQIISTQHKKNKIFSTAPYRYSYIVKKQNLLMNDQNYIII